MKDRAASERSQIEESFGHHQHLLPRNVGWIEVVVGSMFSGKTEELLRRIRRSMIARQPTILFKPRIDTRYSDDSVVSHDKARLPSVVVAHASEILKLAEDALVVGIDEAQFFDESLVQVCNELARQGKRVIVAGLDADYRGQPFSAIPALMASAEYLTKHLAICAQCGNPAHCTQRLVASTEQVLLGSTDAYEARCRRCFEPPSSL